MTRQEAIKQLDGAEVMLLNREFEPFQQAIIMAINALREQEQRRWISVKDRLPNREDADPKGFIIAIDKESNKSKIWWFDIVAKYPQEFTHWMPLPEPPKED